MKKNSSDIQIQGLGFALTVTGLLKVLWNKLLPELFGWKKITYWQSIMLYLICKALFDFRYTIKDSFNFGNNSINGEPAGKKADKKDTPNKVNESAPVKEEPKEETMIKEEIEVEVAENDAEIFEFAKKEKKDNKI